MSTHPIDPAAEWLECDETPDAVMPANTSGGNINPILYHSEHCSCKGTGRIPNPDAPKEIEVRKFVDDVEGVYFQWHAIGRGTAWHGILPTPEIALQVAREALSK